MIGSVVYPTLADSDEEFLVYMMGIELNRLCRNLGRANREMRRALRRGDHQAAWFYLDALLRAAASISRIFWPPNSKYAGRAKLLGRLFHVGRRSPFALRDVRNSFEHFDERIEDWLASGETLVDDANIGPTRPGIRHLRHFDPATGEASYLDRSVHTDRLVAAAARLRRRMRGVTFMLDQHLLEA